MLMMKRMPTFKSCFVLLLPALAALLPAAAARAEEPSLRNKFAERFVIGVGMDGLLPGDYSPDELALVRRHYATLTPANCMKMDEIHPAEGRYNFKRADALVSFAEGSGLKVCGHCLVWAKDERTPAWFFKDGATSASRELLLTRMREHIETVAGRYRGKVSSWDVVNEALSDDTTPTMRASQWLAIGGEDFIAQAFELAHKADPGALLIYNDYNIELPFKRAKLLKLVRGLLERKAPIQAVGLQGHWELDSVPFREIEETIAAIKALGLKVVVSELDIDVVPRGRWWADGGRYRDEMSKLDPYPNGCPPELLARQAEQYARLFEIFNRHAGAIARVTFWDLHDGRSWLNTFPWTRTNYPLLFDRAFQPKPAFKAVMGLKP